MAKNDKAAQTAQTAQTKKGGKGIPRVTSAVMAMDEAGRKAWLASLKVTDEVRAIVEANIAKALKKGTKKAGGKFDADKTIAGLEKLTIEDLLSLQSDLGKVQTAITAKIEAGKAEAIQSLKDRMAADAAALAALGV